MQTFLPFADFERSASILDGARLRKQSVEGTQLLEDQWYYHPASIMWRGHKSALWLYVDTIAAECVRRGYENNDREKIAKFASNNVTMPHWFGNFAFHRAHRSNLLRKDFDYYIQFFEPDLRCDFPYIWPEPLDANS